MRPPPLRSLSASIFVLLVAAAAASADTGSPLVRARESCASRCTTRVTDVASQRACLAQCSASVYTGMAYLSGRMRADRESCYRALVVSSDRSLCGDRVDRKRYLLPKR
jgi:hypothetical protein